MVREYKGAFSGEHGDGLCAANGSPGSSGRGSTPRSRRSRRCSIRTDRMNPGKIVATAEDGRRVAVPLPPALSTALPIAAALDWSAWNVERDPATGDESAPGTGGDATQRSRQGRRDVQQQRPLPQVRRRHDVPELSRHARRAASDARARQHAAPRAVGPARRRGPRRRSRARGARSVRLVQGLPARMPDRRRHGEDEDRVAGRVQRSGTASRCATG